MTTWLAVWCQSKRQSTSVESFCWKFKNIVNGCVKLAKSIWNLPQQPICVDCTHNLFGSWTRQSRWFVLCSTTNIWDLRETRAHRDDNCNRWHHWLPIHRLQCSRYFCMWYQRQSKHRQTCHFSQDKPPNCRFVVWDQPIPLAQAMSMANQMVAAPMLMVSPVDESPVAPHLQSLFLRTFPAQLAWRSNASTIHILWYSRIQWNRHFSSCNMTSLCRHRGNMVRPDDNGMNLVICETKRFVYMKRREKSRTFSTMNITSPIRSRWCRTSYCYTLVITSGK